MDFSFFTLSDPFRIEAAYSFENALIEDNITIALMHHLCNSFCFGGGGDGGEAIFNLKK